jgi:ABC-type uncharacterized transport system YnjBCD permease subunit
MQLGAKHVESPFIEFGQLSTGIYFVYFLVVVLSINLLDNSFILANKKPVHLPTIFLPFISLQEGGVEINGSILIGLAIIVSFVFSIVIYRRLKTRSTHTMLGSTDSDSDGEQDGIGKPTETPVPGRRCPACLERGDTV